MNKINNNCKKNNNCNCVTLYAVAMSEHERLTATVQGSEQIINKQ